MRTDGLSDLLFGKVRGNTLALLYGAPDESFYVRQIARQTETSVGSIQRELKLLTSAALVERSVLGNQVFFRANHGHPAFSELRALLAKTTGVFQLLEKALTPLSARIVFAFVYGSVARGEENASSDIDLMMVGDVSLDEILEAVEPVEKQLRRPINATVYSLHDLERRFRSGNHFLRSLGRAQKVFLIGAEDDFRKAGADRLVQG